MTETIPYTYLIGWTKYNIWYYGARYANGCSPNDLWVTYFTSSKRVKSTRISYGEPDVIVVRKTFAIADEAITWESKVLRRLNCSKREDFLNNQNGSGCKACSHDSYMKEQKSIKMKEYWTVDRKSAKSSAMKEHYAKTGTSGVSNGLKKRYADASYLQNFSMKMKSVNQSSEKREAAGNAIKLKWQNEEYKNKVIESRKGIVWWNNGNQTIKSKECPGPGWVRGRANKNLGRKKNETNEN